MPKLKTKTVLIGIFILSLLIRLLYLYQLKKTPLFGFFAADSFTYHQFALDILEGNLTSKATLHLSPLYPFFLACVYTIFGKNLTAVVSLQIILDALNCVLLYFLCSSLFNRRNLGLLAAFIYAGYSMAIFYSGFILDVTLLTFINLVLILLVLRAESKNKLGPWLACGLVLGLSFLLKASILLFLPFLAVWLLTNKKREVKTRLGQITLLLLGLALVVLPFSIRNYLIEKRLSPLPIQGGINFYIGNNPYAKGGYTSLYDVQDSPIEQVNASIRRAEQETGRTLKPTEASSYWFFKGLNFIKTNPRQYLGLSLRKLFLFWNAEEVMVNLNYYFCKRFLPLFALPFFSFGLISSLGILGIIWAIKNRQTQSFPVISFIAIYMACLILFYVSSRHRFPCLPLIIMFAAYSCCNFIDLIKEKRKKELFLFCLLFLVLVIITNRETAAVNTKNTFVVSYNNLGKVYEEKGLFDQAIAEYQNAIEEKSDYPPAHFNLAGSYYKKGLVDQAIAEYQKTVQINPNHAQAHSNLAVLYFYKKGEIDRAREHYYQALENGLPANPEFASELFQERN
ncbi:glycosyltransferase family 39 protein [Candidatus Omnitrophota bacterium]